MGKRQLLSHSHPAFSFTVFLCSGVGQFCLPDEYLYLDGNSLSTDDLLQLGKGRYKIRVRKCQYMVCTTVRVASWIKCSARTVSAVKNFTKQYTLFKCFYLATFYTNLLKPIVTHGFYSHFDQKMFFPPLFQAHSKTITPFYSIHEHFKNFNGAIFIIFIVKTSKKTLAISLKGSI